MRINLTTPMSDDKERQRRTKAEIDAIEKYTEERMNYEYGRIHTDGSRSGGQPLLKPCPFCGSIDLFVDTVDGSLPPQTGQTVSCEDCTAKASYGDWNTRQPTQRDAVQADIDAMQSILWVDTIIDDQEAIGKAFARHRQYGYDQGYYDGQRDRPPTRVMTLEGVEVETQKLVEEASTQSGMTISDWGQLG